ncbi:MAG: DUF4189 domain-containing protein [Reyranellaceae bacterium]
MRIATGLLCASAIGILLGPTAATVLHARSEAGHVYGAISYSTRNGAFGFSTRHGDSDSANRAAQENCAKRGAGCRVIISFSNLCASVAADDDGGVFWGTAGTRLEAQRQVMFYCQRDGDPKTCEIKAWACSFP